MTCAADIFTALNGTKPTDAGGAVAFLNTMATNVAQAVVTYITSSVTTACAYTGAATGAGTGTFTALVASLLSTPFAAGLNAPADVNNMIAQGFATGLSAMCAVGTVTETVTGVTVTVPPVPITFPGIGSTHVTVPPAHAGAAAAMVRMATEKPAEDAVMTAEEENKLKLMANSLAQMIDVFIPAIALVTAGAGAVGAGVATATTPAADPSFPA